MTMTTYEKIGALLRAVEEAAGPVAAAAYDDDIYSTPALFDSLMTASEHLDSACAALRQALPPRRWRIAEFDGAFTVEEVDREGRSKRITAAIPTREDAQVVLERHLAYVRTYQAYRW